MIFHISLAFTNAVGSISSGSVGEYCDDSKAQTKHWKLVIASSTKARTIDLTTRDLKTIEIIDTNIDRYLYDEFPLLKKYQLARYDGSEHDFDRVLRSHPTRNGDKYSAIFNNCQHFAANFLLLLEALANKYVWNSFKGNDLYKTVIDSVICGDKTFIWNKPNLYLEMTRLGIPVLLTSAGWVGLTTAETAAAATVTTSISVPATGIMGWLGAAPTVTTVTTAAPYAAAAATAATAISLAMIVVSGGSAAYHYQCYSWKKSTKTKNPLVSGFPS